MSVEASDELVGTSNRSVGVSSRTEGDSNGSLGSSDGPVGPLFSQKVRIMGQCVHEWLNYSL